MSFSFSLCTTSSCIGPWRRFEPRQGCIPFLLVLLRSLQFHRCDDMPNLSLAPETDLHFLHLSFMAFPPDKNIGMRKVLLLLSLDSVSRYILRECRCRCMTMLAW